MKNVKPPWIISEPAIDRIVNSAAPKPVLVRAIALLERTQKTLEVLGRSDEYTDKERKNLCAKAGRILKEKLVTMWNENPSWTPHTKTEGLK